MALQISLQIRLVQFTDHMKRVKEWWIAGIELFINDNTKSY